VHGSLSRLFALTARARKSCERVDTPKTAQSLTDRCDMAGLDRPALTLSLP
jgi:hypothetical protein